MFVDLQPTSREAAAVAWARGRKPRVPLPQERWVPRQRRCGSRARRWHRAAIAQVPRLVEAPQKM